MPVQTPTYTSEATSILLHLREPPQSAHTMPEEVKSDSATQASSSQAIGAPGTYYGELRDPNIGPTSTQISFENCKAHTYNRPRGTRCHGVLIEPSSSGDASHCHVGTMGTTKRGEDGLALYERPTSDVLQTKTRRIIISKGGSVDPEKIGQYLDLDSADTEGSLNIAQCYDWWGCNADMSEVRRNQRELAQAMSGTEVYHGRIKRSRVMRRQSCPVEATETCNLTQYATHDSGPAYGLLVTPASDTAPGGTLDSLGKVFERMSTSKCLLSDSPGGAQIMKITHLEKVDEEAMKAYLPAEQVERFEWHKALVTDLRPIGTESEAA